MKKTEAPEKEIDIQTIKSLLDKEPEKRNGRDVMAISNEIKNIAFFKKYQEDGYGDGNYKKYLLGIQRRYGLSYWQIIFLKIFYTLIFYRNALNEINTDSVGDKFYLTLKGKVGVYIRLPKPQKKPDEDQNEEIKKDQNDLTCVKELESGFAFGELALINNKPRLATITCHQDSHFMTLDKLSFILILKQKEEERLFKEMGFFARLPFFEGWNHNLIKLIYLNSFRIKYKKNENIFQEGDEPSSVYIVTEGEFVIQKGFDKIEIEDEYGFKQTEVVNHLKKEATKQKKQIQLAVLVLNEMFGEEDIMNKNKTRSYSAFCSTQKGECIVVKKRDFLIRILHEEGARIYLEKRLRQKNKHMKEKLQKIQGSIADYQNYIYDDCSEQKQKLQITNAISKIESPKKRQKSQVSFMDFASVEIKDENQSPIAEKQTFMNNIISNDKSSNSPFMKQQESQSPKNMKRGFSVVAVGGPPSISKIQSISKTQLEEKNPYLRIESAIQKSKTIIELDKVEQQQNKEMQFRKSFTIIDQQTPWRDQIAKDHSKNISDTFKNLFSFQQEMDKKQQTNTLSYIPGDLSSKRNSKLMYSQTFIIPNSNLELGGGYSPISKKIFGDEVSSPSFKKQLSQTHTPKVFTPQPNLKENPKSRLSLNTDTFSSSIKKLNNAITPKNNNPKSKTQVSTFSIIENSLKYVKNNLSSPINRINNVIIPIQISNEEQQDKSQKNNEQNINQFGIIKLRKSQDHINVLKEELEEQCSQTINSSQDSKLIINVQGNYFDKSLFGKEIDKSQISPSFNKKQIQEENIFQNSFQNNCSFNDKKESKEQSQQPLLINLKLINQDSNDNKQSTNITKNIDSLSQIEDDISSEQNTEDINKIANNLKKSNIQISQKQQPHNQAQNHSTLLTQTKKISQPCDGERPSDSIERVKESISSNQESKNQNQKISDNTHQEINKNINEKQTCHQQVDFLIKQVPQSIKVMHQYNGEEDKTQNLLNDFNQKLINKKKVIHNSSFSPTRGNINEPQLYKFEQQKENNHIKKQNAKIKNTSQNQMQIENEEEVFDNFINAKAKKDDMQSQIKQLENKQNTVTETYFISKRPKSSDKQIKSSQILGHMISRKYYRSIDYQNDEKQNLSIGFSNFVNQTVHSRFDNTDNSISPPISPQNRKTGQINNINQFELQKHFQPIEYNENQFQPEKIRKSQTLKLEQINEKSSSNQNEVTSISKTNNQMIQKQQLKVRAGSFSPDKIYSIQKSSIVFGDNVNTPNYYKQKRFSATRAYNKSEQQFKKSNEYIQSNSYVQLNGAANQDLQNNHSSQNEKLQHHSQNQFCSQLIQPQINNYQNLKQIVIPFDCLNTQGQQNTMKQAAFQEKMRQQIQSSQNIARSSINNPYTNLTLIKQHQQLHQHYSKKPQMVQKISQQNQYLNMKNQSAHQL